MRLIEQIRELLGSYPLLRKRKDLSWADANWGIFNRNVNQKRRNASDYADVLPWPSLLLTCARCPTEQTFSHVDGENRVGGDREERQKPSDEILDDLTEDLVLQVQYVCMGCERRVHHFLLHVSHEGHVSKVGQYPPYDITVGKHIEGLGKNRSALFKHGRVCESQNYSIGAFAYYRRVVEDVIEDLLGRIGEILAEGELPAEYATALEEVRTSKTASEKIALVKDLLPGRLRPGGINPLGVLFGALSEGIHDMTDEQCSEHAEEVRTCLEFLLQAVDQDAKRQAAFTQSMKGILEKKARKNPPA